MAGLLRLIHSFKAIPMIYVRINGGPGTATEVTNFYGFQQAFNFSYWGYASAVAMLMLAGALLAAVMPFSRFWLMQMARHPADTSSASA